ncbi:MAG: indolepyruvate ferredoxin oxidoreductase family protein, partial [Ilumatobacter sp.]|uniref:indolepyruvate ferredoxin oxidoreductase family protein n=1 Tax=Ilumatobacter sp. TaxID=1967498 RepID=UPI003C756B8F
MSDTAYRLSDRYASDAGTVFMTGIQALARMPIEQLRADRAAGLDTAAFASGYQGSPLSGLDQEFVRAAKAAPGITFVVQPNVNEELGATSVMGSQLASTQPDARHDGVLGIWYGKAPGLDRAGDAIRHGVYAGASQHGGALVIVGDDPGAKSSTVPSSSDLALMDLHLPVFFPMDVQEALDLGRHAIAMSRATGLWTSMKIVAAVADGSGTIDVSPDRMKIVLPDMSIDGAPDVHTPDARLLPPINMSIERDIRTVRAERARRYSVANELNRVAVDAPDAWIGIAASGVTYGEVREALRRLGLGTDAEVAAAGIRLLQLRLPLPFDSEVTRRFAIGLEEIIVVEEKDPTLELLVKDALYGSPNAPRVVGKRDDTGEPLIQNFGVLVADVIVPALRRRLTERLGTRLAPEPPPDRERVLIPLSVERSPYFCSGCPHNWGSKVPDDVLVGAGIGCHTMTLLMDEDQVGTTAGLTQMGGEGAQWIGMAPFVDRAHFVQNIGDGTFFHSGQLAIQAAIAAGVDITYKLLHNGTVAMTGGQDAVGALTVPGIAGILIGHGAKRVIITTDDLERYKGVDLPKDDAGTVVVRDRSDIVAAQEELAAVSGVTVLIHDQACAAQNRRLRKRDLVTTPVQRVVINHRICEACGDCGVVSNCLSVQAVDTPLGVKTTIDQTTCNLDFSCLGGDCPSFMTIEPADDDGSTPAEPSVPPAPTDFPDPVLRVAADHVDVRIAGIGGTGVVTAAQILATAAMLDGFDSRGLDQTGLSQKAGPVVSDLRLSTGSTPATNLLGDGTADVLLAFDLLTAASLRTLEACGAETTIVVGSTTATPTGSMVGRPDRRVPTHDELRARLDTASNADATRLADAGELMESLLGNATAANIFVIGAAIQHGALPISAASVEEAIRLNGVHADANIEALRWGRSWIVDPATIDAVAATRPAARPVVEVEPLPKRLARRLESLPADVRPIVEMLTADLVDYQSAAYAASFLDEIERVRPGDAELLEVVARSLHKLMAYKDEYEVARLLVAPESQSAAERVGGADAKITWRLHPPMLKALGRSDKIGVNATVGRPLMLALARGKRLRGTRLDPFGRSEMRRTERELVEEFRGQLAAELAHLAAQPDDRADVLASLALPMEIRGYEDLKLRRVREYRNAAAARAVA